MEVCIDDMITKSMHANAYAGHLKDTINVKKKYQMRFNLEICASGVTSGKFIGFMMQQWGIKANPDKIYVALGIKSPRTFKEVQNFIDRVAALSRFISKSTYRSKSFFKALKAGKKL